MSSKCSREIDVKKFLFLVICAAIVGVMAYQPSRDLVIGYAKIAMNALDAGAQATKNAMDNDLAECQNGTKEQRIACTKRHEAPLDKLHPSMDSAGQQDKLYKAMEQ